MSVCLQAVSILWFKNFGHAQLVQWKWMLLH
jgi:hypothetical protein